MADGIDWTWESFPEYLDAVAAAPKAINYGAQIGHSALRTAVMGERAFGGAATASTSSRWPSCFVRRSGRRAWVHDVNQRPPRHA